MASGDHGGATPEFEEICDFCRRGRVVVVQEEMRFRRMTERGMVVCEVVVPIGRCERCGFAHVGADADAMIEAAVQKALGNRPN